MQRTATAIALSACLLGATASAGPASAAEQACGSAPAFSAPSSRFVSAGETVEYVVSVTGPAPDKTYVDFSGTRYVAAPLRPGRPGRHVTRIPSSKPVEFTSATSLVFEPVPAGTTQRKRVTLQPTSSSYVTARWGTGNGVSCPWAHGEMATEKRTVVVR